MSVLRAPEIPLSNEEILNEIKACHTKSISFASKAAAEDELNQKNEAMANYLKSLRHSENGIRFEIHNTRYSGPEWDLARDMQQGMISTMQNVKQRIYDLQTVEPPNTAPPRPENPPPYSVQDPLNLNPTAPCAPMYTDANAEILLLIESGVQMYFVSSDNKVGAAPPAYPSCLKIFILIDEIQASGPQAILQVGDWVYPLAKHHMPVLHSANGAYIFPNCSTEGMQQGSAVGIVISSEVNRAYVEIFESILRNYALFQSENTDEGFVDLTEFVQDTPEITEQPDLSDRIVTSIVRGADVFGQGIKRSAAYTTKMVEAGSKKMKSRLTPNATPVDVSPNVKKGLYYTYAASSATMRVSQWLVKWLCAITTKVGEQIAPYFNPVTDESDQNGESSDAKGLLKVAKAGMVGVSKIWIELEKAGSAIAKAVTSATVNNVEFKYGPQAGEAATLAMGTAVNLGSTAFTLDNLGIKTMVGVTSKKENLRLTHEETGDHPQATDVAEVERCCSEEKGRE